MALTQGLDVAGGEMTDGSRLEEFTPEQEAVDHQEDHEAEARQQEDQRQGCQVNSQEDHQRPEAETDTFEHALLARSLAPGEVPVFHRLGHLVLKQGDEDGGDGDHQKDQPDHHRGIDQNIDDCIGPADADIGDELGAPEAGRADGDQQQQGHAQGPPQDGAERAGEDLGEGLGECANHDGGESAADLRRVKGPLSGRETGLLRPVL